jgi:hypothetical protein
MDRHVPLGLAMTEGNPCQRRFKTDTVLLLAADLKLIHPRYYDRVMLGHPEGRAVGPTGRMPQHRGAHVAATFLT